MLPGGYQRKLRIWWATWSEVCRHNTSCIPKQTQTRDLMDFLADDLLSTVIVDPVPKNGRVIANGTSSGGIDCGSGVTGNCEEFYGVEQPPKAVTLTALPDSGYQVGTWTGCQIATGNQCMVWFTDAGTVTPRKVSVTFVPITFVLTVSPVPTNGSITATGISCGSGASNDCSEPYNSGTNVTLTGNPAGGFQVGTWTGCTPINNNTQCTVSMTQDRTVSVTFVPITFMITVSPVPTNGSITATGISCGAGGTGDCNESYNSGTTVTLTGSPAGGFQAGTWTGCTPVNNNTQCTVQMTQARTVSVTFTPITFLLTISPIPTNGFVTAAGISCGAGGTGDCTESFNSGAGVTITGNPAANFQVNTWTGCTPINSNTQCTVQMSQAQNVSVTFSAVQIMDTTPPNLVMTSHKNNQTVNSSPVIVSGTASDSGLGNNGISSVTVNGVAATGGTAVGSGTANWSQSVALNLGANTITVVAKDNSPNQNSKLMQITINYQPVVLPSISINNVSLTEGNAGTTPFNFNVTLSSTSSQTVTVSYNTSNGTAVGGASCTGGTDYKSLNSILTFSPGQTSQPISVEVCGDTIPEPDKTFSVSLTSASSATIIPGQAVGVGTILNDDNCNFLGKPAVDFDGDCKSDVGVYRDGAWFIQNSSGGTMVVGWGGAPQDIPVPADYDGDGKTDIAIFRSGAWYILNSSGGTQAIGWGGAPQDIPVPADYDGDGKTDIAIFRSGAWYILNSSGGTQAIGWGGAPQDIPVPADYDGDGKTDIAIYRSGAWYILNSSGGTQAIGWGGAPQDIPVPADYDGDGKTDVAVFRDGAWFILNSTGGTQTMGWGAAGDIPIN